MTLYSLKKQIREEFINKRDTITQNFIDNAKQTFYKTFFHILHYVNLEKYNIFAGYIPIRNELDISNVLTILASKYKKMLCLPVIIDKRLKFFEYNIGDTLIRNSLGVYEPKNCINEMTPDFMMIPLVSFDSNGTRLGFGKGFYDNAIIELKLKSNNRYNSNTIFCGCAYSFQQYTKNLPYEEHDQPLDFVITECCVYKFK